MVKTNTTVEGLKTGSDQLRAYVIKQVDQIDLMATSNKLPDDDFRTKDLEDKVLPPPYDPFQLSVLVETSSILDQCIDVMEVNIDSFGYELKASLADEDMEKLMNGSTKAEIDGEWQMLMNFFKYCNRTMSYIQLRRRLRRDYELAGGMFIEVLRNQLTNRITGLEWLPNHSMRICRIDPYFTDYLSRRKISDTEIEECGDKIKFRRYVQMREKQKKPTWFKEFRDPRIMDAETGFRAKVVRDKTGKIKDVIPEKGDGDGRNGFEVEKFLNGRMKLATEIIYMPNYHSTRTLPYGSPRWIGNLISVMGSRASEEVNLQYFDNKTVPPGMLLVSGGKLTENAVDRITNHIKEHVKGSKNFHSILVVEADSGNRNPNLPAPPNPSLQWVPMTDAQHRDGLFQGYDQNNIDKVISSFRFWSGYVARTKEINVATAEVARQISEEQVFQPERDAFDSMINRMLLVEMGVNYWEHRTKGPQLASATKMADILDKMKPFLTGEEGREICRTIFGREFKEIKEDWLKKPLMLVIAEMSKAQADATQEAARVAAEGKQGKVPGAEPKKDMNPEEKIAEEVKKASHVPETEEEILAFVTKVHAVREALAKAETALAPIAMGR